jgi:hypothetical protein
MTSVHTPDLTTPEARSLIAFHEASHAVMYVLAHRVVRLPPGIPLTIDHAAILERVTLLDEDKGKTGGYCEAEEVYSRDHAARYPQWDWREAMEWQIVVYSAGSVAEAIRCGESHPSGVYRFTRADIGVTSDFVSADAVLQDLNALTRRGATLRRYIVRTFRLLRANWPAVEAIAAVLVHNHRIEGAEIERIFDGASQECRS